MVSVVNQKLASLQTWGGFSAKDTGNGNASFLNFSTESPVQRMLNAQKAEKTKYTPFDETEDFLRMKAFEISNRIKLMTRMGQGDAVNQLRKEAAEVIVKYQALQKKALADAKALGATA